jgi:hypothetical protein
MLRRRTAERGGGSDGAGEIVDAEGSGGMTTREEAAAAADRLRRALLAFQAAQTRLLAAHRRTKALTSAEEVARFWGTQGARLEAAQRAAAEEVDGAFRMFSAAGLVAGAADRHLVTEARRYLAEKG